MLPIRPDMTIEMVDEPPGRICDSGHVAPLTFRRDGEEQPTRFGRVTGHGITGVYCEPCLVIANYLARRKKRVQRIVGDLDVL